MKYAIENEFLKVEVLLANAEMTSIYSKTQNREILWQPDESVFTHQAQILFPTIGKSKDGKITIDNKEYPALMHGFAREYDFVLETQTPTSVAFSFSSSDETKKYCPYNFKLLVTYKLDKHSVIQEFSVINLDASKMYFGLGCHPGFNCLYDDGDSCENYFVDFGKNSNIKELELNQKTNLLTGNILDFQLNNNRLSLNDKMFTGGSFIVTNFDKHQIALRSETKKSVISIDFPDWPYIVIWSKPGKMRFICIEPWCGLQDTENRGFDMESKKGNNCLNGYETFARHIVYTVL